MTQKRVKADGAEVEKRYAELSTSNVGNAALPSRVQFALALIGPYKAARGSITVGYRRDCRDEIQTELAEAFADDEELGQAYFAFTAKRTLPGDGSITRTLAPTSRPSSPTPGATGDPSSHSPRSSRWT